MTVVRITTEALDAMEAQYSSLKRRYAHLAALYAWTNCRRVEAEEECNRLLGMSQESWGPLWEENEHLYRVLSEQ